jgi:hypothetical protein
MKHTVIVWSESCTIDVCKKHKTVWVASGDRFKPKRQRSSAGVRPRSPWQAERPALQQAFLFDRETGPIFSVVCTDNLNAGVVLVVN